MIQIFRRIRQKLLFQNKFSRYLPYAIGEIFLVVIGILIALQINTWNENRVSKSLELKTLKELQADLTQTLEDIRSDSTNFQHVIRSNEIILRHMEEKLPYHDSLIPHFTGMEPFQTFSVNHSTFDNIRQNGSSLISNDSIRVAVASLYTRPINLYKEYEDRVLTEHYENYYRPMIMSAFRIVDENALIPRDYDAFQTNADYKQVLKYSIVVCSRISKFQGFLMLELEGIIGEIDREILTFE